MVLILMQINRVTFLNLLFLSAMLVSCASTQYTVQRPASLPVGDMLVTVGEGWMKAPTAETPGKRVASRTLSRDNLSRDRLMLIPGVGEGEAIFRGSYAKSLPTFRQDMSPDEIADLVARSLQLGLWDDGVTVSASNVRGHGYLGKPGFLFDLSAHSKVRHNVNGLAGGFVHEEHLYVNIFVAQSPDHFNEHIEAARQVIESASIRVKTIRVN